MKNQRWEDQTVAREHRECLKTKGENLRYYSTGADETVLPSQRGLEYESEWYKREETYDPIDSDKANFTKAMWSNCFGKPGVGDRRTKEHWEKASEPHHFKTDASLDYCRSCNLPTPKFRLYKSHRVTEESQEAYDLPSVRKMLRCEGCELRTRCFQDLRAYNDEFDMGITKEELSEAFNTKSIEHISRKKFNLCRWQR